MRKKSLTKGKILDQAGEIVQYKGAKELSIRRLSSELGIAVGTLYNYYPSRDELLHDLFQESWKKTIKSIGDVSEVGPESPIEAVMLAMEIFFKDVDERNGLGKEVIDSSLGFADIRQELITVLCSLIISRTSFNQARAEMRARWILAISIELIHSGEKRRSESMYEFLSSVLQQP